MGLLRSVPFGLAVLALAGCQSGGLPEDPNAREAFVYPDVVATVVAAVETAPVPSNDDAADDPAIWIHPQNPEQSLVLGTDKRSGIAVYALDGSQRQFLPLGLPNNIDLRQQVRVGSWQGDLAAASNRAGDTVSLLSVDERGVSHLGDFPASAPEPYGLCVGAVDDRFLVFVTYKDGMIAAHEVVSVEGGAIQQTLLATLQLDSQLEGCVHADNRRELIVGEENRGIWRIALGGDGDDWFGEPMLIDEIGGPSGIVADVEGVALYEQGDDAVVVASSQGNDSFALYDLASGQFIGRFRVARGENADGVQETDGLAVAAGLRTPAFPLGILVVQDGFNAPAGTPQNFKIIDWRQIESQF